MLPVRYFDIISQSKGPRFLSYKMVCYAKEYSIKPATIFFNITPKTVHKWLPGLMNGFTDQNRIPKRPHRYIIETQRLKIIALKKALPNTMLSPIHFFDGWYSTICTVSPSKHLTKMIFFHCIVLFLFVHSSIIIGYILNLCQCFSMRVSSIFKRSNEYELC